MSSDADRDLDVDVIRERAKDDDVVGHVYREWLRFYEDTEAEEGDES